MVPYFFIGLIIGAAGGFIGGYFIIRNNKKTIADLESRVSDLRNEIAQRVQRGGN